MKSRDGFRGPTGFMHGMDPDLFDAYHGTNQMGLKKIEPATTHGNSVYNISKRDRTYFMDVSHANDPQTSEHRAWTWAESAANSNGGRPTVYRTQPMGVVSEDTNLAHGEGAFTTSTQHVRSEITTPPRSVFRRYDKISGDIVTPDAVQGTIPGVNWAQFGGTRDPLRANATPIWQGQRETHRNDRPARDMGAFGDKPKEVPGQRTFKL